MTVYDLCVVGAGMIGSAAARHAAMTHNTTVCLIGPSEPKNRLSNDHGIYGAHYDEGRITRATDMDPVWAKLAQESIKRYRNIEQESGLLFYKEVGNLMVGTNGHEFITSVTETVTKQGIHVHHMDADEMKRTFPYLKFGTNDRGIYERANAGHISPRTLVQAQQRLAEKHGCDVIDDVVCQVDRTVQSDGNILMTVKTEGGKEVLSKTVLLATGAFTEFRELLPDRIKPDQLLCPLTVALVQVSEEYAKQLKDMPTVIYSGGGHAGWDGQFPRNIDGTASFYMLPPVKYPDGYTYVKLGHFHGSVPRRLQTAAEVKQWFLNGDTQLADATRKFIGSLFNGLQISSWHGDSCVVVETPTNRPYIDKVHAQLGVAIGGNGYAAKSSDEIGRLGAAMMLRGWDSDIPRKVFKLKTLSQTEQPTKTRSML